LDHDKQILELRERIDTLEASLDSHRTPYIKSQLLLARHDVDDAESMLRHAVENPMNAHMWRVSAAASLQHADQKYRAIDDLVKKFGGPTNVQEVG
jgi:hypothetical protein